MRILFTTTRGAGHFNPLVPFAQACVRAGHEVLVARAPRRCEPQAQRAGLPFSPFPEPPEDELEAAWRPVFSLPLEKQDEHVRARGLRGLSRARRAARHARADRALGRGARRARERRVLRRDRRGAARRPATRRSGVSLAAATDRLYIGAAAPVVDELRTGLGLDPDPDAERLLAAPLLTRAPASLDDARLARRRTSLPRGREPSAPLPDWWDGSDEPLVYMSFGTEVPTMPFYPGLYRAALAALAQQPLRVLVTIGDKADPAELGELPGERARRALGPAGRGDAARGGDGRARRLGLDAHRACVGRADGAAAAVRRPARERAAGGRDRSRCPARRRTAGARGTRQPPSTISSTTPATRPPPAPSATRWARCRTWTRRRGCWRPWPLLMAVLGDGKQSDKQDEPGRQRRHRRIAEARPQGERRAHEDRGDEEGRGPAWPGGHASASVTLSDPSGGSSATIVSPGDTANGGTTEPVITSSPARRRSPDAASSSAVRRSTSAISPLSSSGASVAATSSPSRSSRALTPSARERPVSTGPSRTWRL